MCTFSARIHTSLYCMWQNDKNEWKKGCWIRMRHNEYIKSEWNKKGNRRNPCRVLCVRVFVYNVRHIYTRRLPHWRNRIFLYTRIYTFCIHSRWPSTLSSSFILVGTCFEHIILCFIYTRLAYSITYVVGLVLSFFSRSLLLFNGRSCFFYPTKWRQYIFHIQSYMPAFSARIVCAPAKSASFWFFFSWRFFYDRCIFTISCIF